jgi:hypothetical protein
VDSKEIDSKGIITMTSFPHDSNLLGTGNLNRYYEIQIEHSECKELKLLK